MKKEALSGGYVGGGPITGPNNRFWGLNVVVTSRAPAGFPLVGNFARGGQVWRRGPTRLELFNSHLGWFARTWSPFAQRSARRRPIYDPAAFAVCNLAS